MNTYNQLIGKLVHDASLHKTIGLIQRGRKGWPVDYLVWFRISHPAIRRRDRQLRAGAWHDCYASASASSVWSHGFGRSEPSATAVRAGRCGEGDPRGDGVQALRRGPASAWRQGGPRTVVAPAHEERPRLGPALHSTPRRRMRASSPRGAAGFRIRLPVTAAAPSPPMVLRTWEGTGRPAVGSDVPRSHVFSGVVAAAAPIGGAVAARVRRCSSACTVWIGGARRARLGLSSLALVWPACWC